MRNTIPESAVASFWKQRGAGLTGLVTEEAGPVTVIFPGRLNDDHGADFRDAILATRRGLLIGDVEVHVDSGGWWDHRHHLDPVYNRVILHVVARHNSGRPAGLQDGRTVPTLNLGPYLDTNRGTPRVIIPDMSSHLPCYRYHESRTPEQVDEILDAAGDERFQQRIEVFRSALENIPAEEVLYGAVMEALGYHRNREPMRRLADALPVAQLRRIVRSSVRDDEYITICQALLLGTAGLLPSQREVRNSGYGCHGWVSQLEAAWRHHGGRAVLSERDWHFSRVRPGNYPVRRITAAGYLLQRFRQDGPISGITGIIEQTGESGARRLVKELVVPATDYWYDHLDFGQPSTGPGPALCGMGRAADIVLNAVFPFMAACLPGKSGNGVWDLYRSFPGLPGNTIITNMSRLLGIARRGKMTARHQQGLLHIHRTWCSTGSCQACPIGRREGYTSSSR